MNQQFTVSGSRGWVLGWMGECWSFHTPAWCLLGGKGWVAFGPAGCWPTEFGCLALHARFLWNGRHVTFTRLSTWRSSFPYGLACTGGRPEVGLSLSNQLILFACLNLWDMVQRPGTINQALRFRGLCCSCSQLQNWALCMPSFEPNSINSQKKVKTCNGKSEDI